MTDKLIYVVLIDNTVYTTAYVSFEGVNLVFNVYDDKNVIVTKKLNYTLIDSIRSTI